MIVIIIHIFPRNMGRLTKSRPKLEFMYSTSACKSSTSLTDSWGQSKDKRVVLFVPLSIDPTSCGYRPGWGSGGDPAITPSEKKK